MRIVMMGMNAESGGRKQDEWLKASAAENRMSG